MARSLHSDAGAILSRLAQEGVNALYHFTSVENLPGICQLQALCSRETLEGEGQRLPLVTGGNPLSHSLDRYRGNWDKVSLNLTPYTPMAYHRKKQQHLCFLVISPKVAAWSGVVFTDTNATSNDHRRGEGVGGLDFIKFEIIRSTAHPDKHDWKRYVQAEVLVPDRIPFEYVSEIHFVSKASMAHAEQLCSLFPHPRFMVNERLFSDSPRSSQGTIGFPYVIELILTDAKIDKNMVYFSYNHKNRFSKSSDLATLVAKVKAMAGTQARVLLHPTNIVGTLADIIETTEFEKSEQYYHWHQISLKELSHGLYKVEYYLNEICWASTDFEVIQ